MNYLKNLFYLSVLSAALLTACQTNDNSSNEQYVDVNGEKIPLLRVDLVEDSATTIGWSAIFEDVDIIPLETSENCMIRNWTTGLSPTSIYLATQVGMGGAVRLMEFDLDGKYLRDYGSGGRGPGEHTGYMMMGVRYYPEFNCVLAEFNGIPSENHLFTPDGKFIDNVDNPFELGGALARLGDDLYVTMGASYGRPTYYRDSVLLEWHNSKGETVKSISRVKYPTENSHGYTPFGASTSLYKYDDGWHLFSPGNDTVYKLIGQDINPIGVFKMGEQYVQLNEIIDPKQVLGHFNIEIIAENEHYWILSKRIFTKNIATEYRPGQWGGEVDFDYSFIFLDKRSGKSWNVKFEDDLLGIIPSENLNYYFKWDDSGQFYIIVGALNLIEKIDEAVKDGSIPNSAIDKVKKLRQSIDEESNPVLFMFKQRQKYRLN